jgi:hypothetical protein
VSDATLVAQEIQDLATSVGEVATALRERDPQIQVNVPALAPPTVNVNVPEPLPVEPPVVNVNVPQQAAPVVNVAPANVQVKPQITLLPALPTSYSVRITERDANGFISAFIITPESVG